MDATQVLQSLAVKALYTAPGRRIGNAPWPWMVHGGVCWWWLEHWLIVDLHIISTMIFHGYVNLNVYHKVSGTWLFFSIQLGMLFHPNWWTHIQRVGNHQPVCQVLMFAMTQIVWGLAWPGWEKGSHLPKNAVTVPGKESCDMLDICRMSTVSAWYIYIYIYIYI